MRGFHGRGWRPGLVSTLLLLPVLAWAQASAPVPPHLQPIPQLPANTPASFLNNPTAQNSPVLSNMPPLAHEAQPVTWPVADYFAQALSATPLRPAAGASALRLIDAGTKEPAPEFVTVPVQTQAFGFSPMFRALAGAELDRVLETAGVSATRQTEAADAYGPFVRRVDDAALDAFSTAQKRKLITLYLGHDGIGQMFATLSVRDAASKLTAHRTLPMPAEAAPALDALVPVLRDLVREAKLPARTPPTATGPQAAGCDPKVWSLAPPSRSAPPAERACHALAVAMLLPYYDIPTLAGDIHSDAHSPARLAWLAQAQALASPEALPAETAALVRKLAWRQLGLLKEVEATLPPSSQVKDPVLRLVVEAKSLKASVEQGPNRSSRDALENRFGRVMAGVSPMATAAWRAQLDFDDSFGVLDLCTLERQLPQTMTSAECRRSGDSAAPSRAAWPAETLLYQEWRLASHYKAVSRAGIALGSRSGVDEALARWPADVAAHPYLRRLRHVITQSSRQVSGSTEEQIVQAREATRSSTQASADLQRADRWLQRNSLSGMLIQRSRPVFSDSQVRDAVNDEDRMVLVLRFDRFAMDRYMAQRQPGDRATFLAPNAALRLAAMGLPQLVVLSDTPLPPRPPKGLFARSPNRFSGLSDEQLRNIMSGDAVDVATRVTLAQGLLQRGATIAEARRIIDSAVPDERRERRVAQSHAWAEPAHYFFFGGELEASRVYYRKVVDTIGTGSDSDLLSRIRVSLLDGHRREALDRSAQRVTRYDSDFARRDQAGLHFMYGETADAWKVALPRLASTHIFQLWVAPYTGHRMQGLSLRDVEQWVVANKLHQAEIDRVNSGQMYAHLYAVMDRLPEEGDIAQLKRPPGATYDQDRMWSASARLVRSALLGQDHAQAVAEGTSAIKSQDGNQAVVFLQSLYAWNAWLATDGKHEFLTEVRAYGLPNGFEELLTKSMVLALDGQKAESLKLFRAARLQLAEAPDRRLPGPYSWALAGVLMHRKTGQDGYRQETLRFVRATQVMFPYYGWAHAMEAMLETDPKMKLAPACRAWHLDRWSYFLKAAKVPELTPLLCRPAVAALLLD